jgi:hypothetical protein
MVVMVYGKAKGFEGKGTIVAVPTVTVRVVEVEAEKLELVG